MPPKRAQIFKLLLFEAWTFLQILSNSPENVSANKKKRIGRFVWSVFLFTPPLVLLILRWWNLRIQKVAGLCGAMNLELRALFLSAKYLIFSHKENTCLCLQMVFSCCCALSIKSAIELGCGKTSVLRRSGCKQWCSPPIPSFPL